MMHEAFGEEYDHYRASTWRVLPWVPKTGWLLCDIYFTNGNPVPFSARRILRDALTSLGTAGFDYLAGLEVEFHLFKIDNTRLTPEDSTWPPTPTLCRRWTTGSR